MVFCGDVSGGGDCESAEILLKIAFGEEVERATSQ